MQFKNWLNSPKVIIPFVKERLNSRLEEIHDKNLRDDYQEGINDLIKILSDDKDISQIHRRSLRHYEITRDHMWKNRDADYIHDLNRTKCFEDFYRFTAALEDMSNGEVPDLEKL